MWVKYLSIMESKATHSSVCIRLNCYILGHNKILAQNSVWTSLAMSRTFPNLLRYTWILNSWPLASLHAPLNHTHVHTHTSPNTRVHTSPLTHARTYPHTRAHTRGHKQVPSHTHLRTLTHMRTRTQTHARAHSNLCVGLWFMAFLKRDMCDVRIHVSQCSFSFYVRSAFSYELLTRPVSGVRMGTLLFLLASFGDWEKAIQWDQQFTFIPKSLSYECFFTKQCG